MPEYRRAYVPGGTFFFTLVTEQRAAILCQDKARKILHSAIEQCRAIRPFALEAIVLLPDHLHALWTLPNGDTDFSVRWAAIKATFTREYLLQGGKEIPRSLSREQHGGRGVWQRRFWEHSIRDEEDFANHLHYIHYNPVKHGHAQCPHEWPYSTFHKWVQQGVYESDWLCTCKGQSLVIPECVNNAGKE